MKECRKKNLSFSPPCEPWIPFSSLRALDSLSIYLRINSLTNTYTIHQTCLMATTNIFCFCESDYFIYSYEEYLYYLSSCNCLA